MAFQMKYSFEEVTTSRFGAGMYLDGVATLADNDGDGDFYVTDIELGGRFLDRTNPVDNYLFKEIAASLYLSKSAAAEYADAWNDSREAVFLEAAE